MERPTSIDFHLDIMCPYAFQTSLWIRNVRAETDLEITWRFFSLEEVNRRDDQKHPWEREWSYGWSMMRIGALLRRTSMDDLDRWYLGAGTGLPGRDEGAGVAVALDEMETALGFIVGKRAGLAQGDSVTFDLTGPGGRVRHVAMVDGRAVVVDERQDPTVCLTMPVGTFARLAGGRMTRDDVEVDVVGDEATGEQVLAAMNFTI